MSRWTPIRAILVLALVVASAAVSGPAAAAGESVLAVGSPGGDGVAPATSSSSSAAFSDDEIRVERGDLLTVTVVHSEPARFHLGGEGSGYHLEVALSGSGKDRITIDTYNSTGQPETYVTGGNATLHTLPLARPLAPTRYVMNVTIDGVEQDLGTVVVEEPPETTIRSYVRPAADLDTVESVDADGLEPGSRAARGDLVVLRVDERGLETALDPADLSGGAAAEGIELSFVEADPGLNSDPHRFVPGDNVSVFTDFPNDRVWVVWDTTSLPFEERTRYHVTLSLNPRHNDLVDDRVTLASTTVTLSEPDVDLDAPDGFTVYPWEPRTLTVTGETNLAPGTTLDVRGRATEPRAFLKRNAVTVSPNGTFETTFDLADVPRNSSFPVWVQGYREESVETVRVTDERASVRFRDQAGADRVTVRRATLGLGGFVRLEDSSGTTRGVSGYLEPGTHENLTLALDPRLGRTSELTAVAVMDRDDDRTFEPGRDAPYTPNGTGTRIADTATVTVQQTVTAPPVTADASPAPTTPATAATGTPASAASPSVPVRTETPLTPVSKTKAPLSPLVPLLALALAGLLAMRSGPWS